MKSTLKYILIALLPLLLWTGCDWETKPSDVIPDHCIEITLGGLHPTLSTKATSRGADAYNENLVESVDCFFYPEGGTGSDAVFMALGRGAEAVAEGDSTVYRVKIFFTDADANRMFGSTVSGTCQLYVICNAPLSYSGHTDVATLKNLVVENDFTAQTIQGSFVMSADEVATVTLSTDAQDKRTASGRIKVSRAAAKIQFYLLIPDEFEDESHQIWEPVLSAGIGISMSNAVKRGKVDGEYSVQTADYVSYGSRAISALPAGDEITGYEQYRYTHVPFYSYPCSWSDLSDYATTVVFRIPWRIVGESDYQWKKYQLSPNISTLNLERNKYYRTFVNVRSLGGADKESLVIIPECDYEILPWMNESASGGGQGIVPGELITYKYLVMDHPEQTINNETTVYFSYVSSSPVSEITINKVDYYVNTNSSPKQTANVNRSITANRETFSVNSYVGNLTVNKENPGYVTLSHSLDDMYSSITVYATVTNEDGCTQDIIFVQNPSIRLLCDYTHMGNVFMEGFFNRVYNSPFGFSSGNSIYRTDSRSENHYNVGTVNGNNYGDYGSITNGSEHNASNLFLTEVNVAGFNSTNNRYSRTIDGVTGTDEYLIGDPRVPASSVFPAWSLFPYLESGTGQGNAYVFNNNVYKNWVRPGEIMIAVQDPALQNYIAPRFLVSSNYNSQGDKPTSFENAVKRAATYQEAGYPAGRWRLPTEAEVAFIYARQQDHTIPELFSTSSGRGYIAASGKRINVDGSATISLSTMTNNNNFPSSRFVYDLWYWGDEPSTANVYHPNGHIYNYDSAGNATPIR